MLLLNNWHTFTFCYKTIFYKVYSYFKFNLLILEGLSREYKKAGQKTGLSEQRTPLGKKEKENSLWKQGLASREDYRASVCICRKKIRKAKTQLELTLASETSDNELDFLKYVNSKRRSKENIGLIKYLTSKHEEKAKEFNTFLPHFLILMMNLGLLNLSWSMMTEGSSYF